MWKRNEETEKFKKALDYLSDLLIPTVKYEKQRLEFKIINFLFFNKI